MNLSVPVKGYKRSWVKKEEKLDSLGDFKQFLKGDSHKMYVGGRIPTSYWIFWA